MSTKITFKRGTEAQVDATTPDSGEPVWKTDTKELVVGDGATAGGIDATTKAHAASHTDGTDDIQDAAADDSTKGIATFEADDFDSASGKIDLADAVAKSVSTDGSAATPSTHALTIAGGTGITTSGAGATVTITGDDAAADDSTKGVATFEADDFDSSSGKIDLAVSVTKASTTDSGTATPTAHDLNIVGGEGISTSGAGAVVTIAGEDASDTNKGIASFDAQHFTVTSGNVDLSIDDTPVNGETDEPITSNWAFDHNAATTGVHGAGGNTILYSDHTSDVDAHGEPVVTCDTNSATADDLAFSIVGGEGIDTSGATTVVTIACEAASTTNVGAVELATGAETNTGTSATLAVTPDGLDDWTGSAQITTVGTLSAGNVTAQVSAASDTAAGKVELATGAETNTGTSTTLAVTPDGLDDWTGSGQITTVGTLSSGDVTAQVSAATTSAAGKSELAIASEINTGDDTARTISPKELSDSNYGKRIIYIKVLANDTALTTGDGKAIITIPIELNGMNLVLAHAAVYTTSSSGNPAISLLNLDGGNGGTEMLSTSITIDASELTSYTASTPPVIDGGEDDVATSNRISVNVDTAGTDTTGLDVILTFQLP